MYKDIENMTKYNVLKKEIEFLSTLAYKMEKNTVYLSKINTEEYMKGYKAALEFFKDRAHNHIYAMQAALPESERKPQEYRYKEARHYAVCSDCGAVIEKREDYGYSRCQECGVYGSAVFLSEKD